MTARNRAWELCSGWQTIPGIMSATGYRRSTVLQALRALESEGRIEKRFTDGVGEEFRRTGDPPGTPKPTAAETALKALEGGPMTTAQLQSAIWWLSPSGVRHGLLYLEATGRAVRDRDREPHLWRKARWRRGRGRSTTHARGG